jgi:hypothetical protein
VSLGRGSPARELEPTAMYRLGAIIGEIGGKVSARSTLSFVSLMNAVAN